MRTALLIVAFAACLHAQRAPVESDFVGTWTLRETPDAAAGKLGSTLTISISKTLMHVEQSPGISVNKKRLKRRIDLRGKSYPNESLGGPTITKAYWQGDSIIVFEKMAATVTGPGAEVTRTETWTLSDDFRTLTIKTAWKKLRICEALRCVNEDLEYEQVFEREK